MTQIAAEKPGDVKYKDKRLIAMYFDLTAMPPGDKLRALEAAEKFIRTQMTSSDLVSIMRYGGGSVDVLQDFTDDHNKLLSILETLIVGENQQTEDTTNDASSGRYGSGVWAGQRRVQPVQYGSAALGAADGGEDAGAAE